MNKTNRNQEKSQLIQENGNIESIMPLYKQPAQAFNDKASLNSQETFEIMNNLSQYSNRNSYISQANKKTDKWNSMFSEFSNNEYSNRSSAQDTRKTIDTSYLTEMKNSYFVSQIANNDEFQSSSNIPNNDTSQKMGDMISELNEINKEEQDPKKLKKYTWATMKTNDDFSKNNNENNQKSKLGASRYNSIQTVSPRLSIYQKENKENNPVQGNSKNLKDKKESITMEFITMIDQ